MTHDDVSTIERELGITVHDAYRELVTDYPPALLRHTADSLLLDDPARVIELNRSVRGGTFYDVTWPEEYFAIGETAEGDYYCVDITNDAPPVMYFEHGSQAFTEAAVSIDEWCRELMKKYGGT